MTARFQNILALDTAMAGASAAVLAGERAALRSSAMARGQAEHLVPFAQEAMQDAGIEYAQLDAVLCTIGPGAFTGLRIGMSAARAYGLSLDIPVFGVTTCQALVLAFAEKENAPCMTIIETKRSDFYVQSFDESAKAVSEPQALEGADVIVPDGAVLIGDGAARFISERGLDGASFYDGYSLPDMILCGRVLQQRGADEFFTQDPQPVYLRGADVSTPKKPPRMLAQN